MTSKARAVSCPKTRKCDCSPAYQLGNLLAWGNATLQAGLAHHYGGDYAFALAVVAAVVAVAVAALAGFGLEARVRFGGATPKPAE